MKDLLYAVFFRSKYLLVSIKNLRHSELCHGNTHMKGFLDSADLRTVEFDVDIFLKFGIIFETNFLTLSSRKRIYVRLFQVFQVTPSTSLSSNHNGLSLSSLSTFFNFQKFHARVANTEYYGKTINNKPNKL